MKVSEGQVDVLKTCGEHLGALVLGNCRTEYCGNALGVRFGARRK
jgi:hypothetical protein